MEKDNSKSQAQIQAIVSQTEREQKPVDVFQHDLSVYPQQPSPIENQRSPPIQMLKEAIIEDAKAIGAESNPENSELIN